MLRRFTAVIGMLAILGLLGLLVWDVYHHRWRIRIGESAILAKFPIATPQLSETTSVPVVA